MQTNTISYVIDNEINKVIYTKNINKHLIKDINILKSDQRILFIYDKNISKKYTDEIKSTLKLTGNIFFSKEIEGKKNNKNLGNLLKLFDQLIKNKFTKNSIIISCGGGVVGDMCGLLSSLYLRGTIYFHIPTTMTAIVDSCIGGKTSINFYNHKNQLGNFNPPKKIFVDTTHVVTELDHPRVYYTIKPEVGFVICGYSNTCFVLKDDADLDTERLFIFNDKENEKLERKNSEQI